MLALATAAGPSRALCTQFTGLCYRTSTVPKARRSSWWVTALVVTVPAIVVCSLVWALGIGLPSLPPELVAALQPPPAQTHPHPLPDEYEPVHHGGIDFETGLYVRWDEDLVIRGPVPLMLRRTYRTVDPASRAFGVGGTSDAELFVVGDREKFAWVAIVLDDGSQVIFDRITPGTFYSDAAFRHLSSPTKFYGALLGWLGHSWGVRLADGEYYEFDECGRLRARPCGLLQYRDRDGHIYQYHRDREGLLQRVDVEDEWMAFEYDSDNRVVRASNSRGDHVSYTYDRSGRLDAARYGDGTVRRYTYDESSHGGMVTAVDPDFRIENVYDQEQRVVRQTSYPPGAAPIVIDISYREANGRIVETDEQVSDGRWARYGFAPTGYTMNVEGGSREGATVAVAFLRDRLSNAIVQWRVRCSTPNWSKDFSGPVEPTPQLRADEQYEDRLAAVYCNRALELLR